MNRLNLSLSFFAGLLVLAIFAGCSGISDTYPVASSQTITTPEDTAKSITLSASLGKGSALTYTIVSSPLHGSLSGTAPTLVYTPASNYSGTDSFTFRANDGTADSNTATITITVTGVNDTPIANSQSVSTNKGTPAIVTLSASDAETASNLLVWTVVSQPTHGGLTGVAPNLTYTPATSYVGTDSFTFKVNDGSADSAVATVSITVITPSPAPTNSN
jgi:hypothetical protein